MGRKFGGMPQRREDVCWSMSAVRGLRDDVGCTMNADARVWILLLCISISFGIALVIAKLLAILIQSWRVVGEDTSAVAGVLDRLDMSTPEII